jgi:hypothetical protein
VIWPLPVVIAVWMTGAEITLPSRMMANRLPMFSVVASPNLRAPWLLKRLVVLVELAGGAGDHVAGHQLALLDQFELSLLALVVRQQLRSGGDDALGGFLGRDTVINHLEAELGRLTDDVLQLLRIGFAGGLDQDAVRALGFDAGFFGAQRVDPAADDLAGLADGLGRQDGLGFGQDGEDDLLAITHDAEVTDAAAGRLDQALHAAEGVIHVRRIVDGHHHGVGRGAKAAEGDRYAGQVVTHVLDQVGQPGLFQAGGVSLQQQRRAALQVQAQVQRLGRNPGRQRGQDGFRQKVGNGEQDAKDRRQGDKAHLPFGKLQHGLGAAQDLASLAGAGEPLMRTS